MKKTIPLLFFLFVSLSLFAQEDRASQSLWILSDMRYPVDYPREAIINPQGKWIPYLGTTPLSKSEFFTLGGHEEYARQEKRMQTAKDAFLWGTAISLVASVVSVLTISDQKAGLVTMGSLMGAAVAFASGAIVYDLRLSATFTIPIALDIAQEYNKKLF